MRLQLGISFIISIFMVLVEYAIRGITAPSQDPIVWAGFSNNAHSLAEYYPIAGGLFGTTSGYILMKKHIAINSTSSFLTRIGRCLVGFGGLGLIYFSMGVIINGLIMPESIPAFTLGYIQFALVTFWVFFTAPWLLMKLCLIKPVFPAPI